MGLGRITRFARTPAGARRVSVMRKGSAGIKALAPSEELLADFQRAKERLRAGGLGADAAHAGACEEIDYRRRFLAQMRGDPAALAALRSICAESRTRDVYLMCMCPYRTRDRACHGYLLLDLAREIDPALAILDEPPPERARGV